MMKHLSFALGLALFAPAAAAQSFQQDKARAPLVRQTPPSLLQAFHIRAGRLQDLAVPGNLPEAFEVRADFAGEVRTLVLHAHDIRSPNFRLLVYDARGLHQRPTPPSITYRGHVKGAPASLVAASLYDRQLNASIWIDENTSWAIQPVNDVDKGYAKTAHIAYDNRAILPIPGTRCGNADIGVPVRATPGAGGGAGIAALKLAELGVDADIDFYIKKGSNVSATQAAVMTVTNAVDVIYKRDVEITYKITQIIVRTSRVYSGSISNRLAQFRSRWNAYHGGIKRDLAHLYTGEGSFSGVIGVAYLGVVCNLGAAYGTSKAFHSSTSVNAGLVAHEKGHNWNAPHCNSYGSDCKIMCSGLGGCGRDISRFGNYSKSRIIAFKNTRGCLSDPGPPAITKLTPNQVTAFAGGNVTIEGTGLSGATKINVGSKVLTSFIKSGDTKLTFNAPQATAIGAVQVTVENSTGKSNGLTMTYVETSPPKLSVGSFAFTGAPLQFDFGGKPGAIALMLWNGDAKTFKIFGADLLIPIVLLPTGVLDSVGIGKLQFTPGNELKGIRIWSQIVTFSGINFAGASNIAGTLFL